MTEWKGDGIKTCAACGVQFSPATVCRRGPHEVVHNQTGEVSKVCCKCHAIILVRTDPVGALFAAMAQLEKRERGSVGQGMVPGPEDSQ